MLQDPKQEAALVNLNSVKTHDYAKHCPYIFYESLMTWKFEDVVDWCAISS